MNKFTFVKLLICIEFINLISYTDLLWLWKAVALGGRLSVEPQALGHLHPHPEWPDVFALLVDATATSTLPPLSCGRCGSVTHCAGVRRLAAWMVVVAVEWMLGGGSGGGRWAGRSVNTNGRNFDRIRWVLSELSGWRLDAMCDLTLELFFSIITNYYRKSLEVHLWAFRPFSCTSWCRKGLFYVAASYKRVTHTQCWLPAVNKLINKNNSCYSRKKFMVASCRAGINYSGSRVTKIVVR